MNVLKLHNELGPDFIFIPFEIIVEGYDANPYNFPIPTQPPDFGIEPSAIAEAQIYEFGLCIPLP